MNNDYKSSGGAKEANNTEKSKSDSVIRLCSEKNFLIVLENCLALCEEALIRIESGRALKRVEAVLLKDLSRRTVGKRLDPSERKLKADGACKFN